MCEVMVTGSRRGAMMAVLGAAHPDILAFIAAKREPGTFSHFNFSVLVEDALLQAVRRGDDWPLRFPCADGAVAGKMPAPELWERILRSAYDSAEPGVVFIDRVNRENNLHYAETLHAVNPCGELPLPPYGACVLGSLNLTAYVRAPFAATAHLDHAALARDAALAVRFLDDALELSHFPLARQRAQALRSRRLGLGITGLADALVLLGLDYGTEAARAAAGQVMATIADASYAASIALAREKGGFPALDPDLHAEAPFVRRRGADIVADLRRFGIRNSHLLAIAPAGSISLLAGNVSSGLEPVFARDYVRTLHGSDGQLQQAVLRPYSVMRWQEEGRAGQPPALVTAEQVPFADQLRMQAVLQAHVDNAISKTVTVPATTDFATFRGIYEMADALALKGCAVYRTGTRGDAVMHCTQDACS
jgi:ribonucleoside-diphosphate reductase alpha chain